MLRSQRMLRYVFALALVALSPCAHAAAVALVTDVVGDASQGGEPVRLLAELQSGTELALGDQARVVVFYFADGSEWTLAGPGTYRFGARAPDASRGTAAPQKRVAPAALRDFRLRTDRIAQGGVVMRGAERPALIAPVDEVVLDPGARLAWESFGAGASYQVEVVDAAGSRLVAVETADAQLALPASATLQPGRTYYWSVRGRDDSGTRTFYRVAEFRVADAATRRRLDAARPAPDAPFSERALYAAMLEEAGARSAAQAVRSALAPERPAPWAPAR